MAIEIVRCEKVSPWKKFYLVYSFFFVRKIVARIVRYTFYCVVLPATIVIPEVQVPIWGAIYVPSMITFLNVVGNLGLPRFSSIPTKILIFTTLLHRCIFWLDLVDFMLCRSLHVVIFWVPFENVMSLHRTKATLIGLLEGQGELIMTEKLGDVLKAKSVSKAPKKPCFRIGDRIRLPELFVGFYLFFCGCYDVNFGKNRFFVYLFLQSMAFFVAAFGYVGTFVPNS